MRPIRILIIDDGIGFGGAIVSAANLIRALDRSRFDPIFVTATNRTLLASALREAAPATRVAVARRWRHGSSASPSFRFERGSKPSCIFFGIS